MSDHINTSEDHWFTIEPYTYVNFAKEKVLLYNTIDSSYIESSEPIILDLIRDVLLEKNGGVILLSKDQLKETLILNFIADLRKKYLGDIIPISLSLSKPVQLIPVLNFQKDKHRLKEEENLSVGENIMENLYEVIFKVQSDDADFNFNHIFNQIKNVPIITFEGEISTFHNDKTIINSLKNLNGLIIISSLYTNVSNILPNTRFSYHIRVKFPIEMNSWKHVYSHFFKSPDTSNIVIFEVESEEDCLKAEEIIDTFNLSRFDIQPVYNGRNDKFFSENIYLNKEDIFSSPLSLKEIFRNKILNHSYFGKIWIHHDGMVYTNSLLTPIGNIKENTIKDLLLKEFGGKQSWFAIRDKKPCCNCLYQFLCPPPSNYEILIGKPNLCHIES